MELKKRADRIWLNLWICYKCSNGMVRNISFEDFAAMPQIRSYFSCCLFYMQKQKMLFWEILIVIITYEMMCIWDDVYFTLREIWGLFNFANLGTLFLFGSWLCECLKTLQLIWFLVPASSWWILVQL